jgi:hypothetical protein
MLKPTDDELKTAAKLEIEGADKMTGPEIREAIKRARARIEALRAGREEYDRWTAMCRALGARIQGGKGTPSMDELKRFYANELPAALVNRGIVPGARLTIPAGKGIANSGRATVGKTWPMGADQHITITLTFDGAPAHTYDAWLVWRHATNIRRPRR